jgi:hypothetical protein
MYKHPCCQVQSLLGEGREVLRRQKELLSLAGSQSTDLQILNAFVPIEGKFSNRFPFLTRGDSIRKMYTEAVGRKGISRDAAFSLRLLETIEMLITPA